ncbi:3-keto-5-aminohexanoate cleavage protein [Zavarzinia sp.]|uniref:3-keto-5-aminohexanoate cleavage protein n=1 Tax=Zavarzinia sp. TaxID=2027920 RepID=UPI0035662956
MITETIVTCAVTGAGNTRGRNPHVPVTPKEIAAAVAEAAAEGAAIAHIHVRDPETGLETWTPALFREVMARIRERGTDIIVNLTTGTGADIVVGADGLGLSGFLAEQMDRIVHVEELKPEICSLDCGTMNFGGGTVFVNTEDWLVAMAKRLRDLGVKPEMEVFDLGHVRLARSLVERGLIGPKPLFQICLGVSWGAPATTEAMLAMRNGLPAEALWSAFGIGRQQMPMAVQSVLMGGNVRVGLEDNLYIEHGRPATNGALVAKAVDILGRLGVRPLTPAEARLRLGLER